MADATHTVRLHRVLRAPAERVYRAFLDPDAMAKWLPPHGFTGKVHESDARVGGGYRMSFSNFRSGTTHVFGGYCQVVDHPPQPMTYYPQPYPLAPSATGSDSRHDATH